MLSNTRRKAEEHKQLQGPAFLHRRRQWRFAQSDKFIVPFGSNDVLDAGLKGLSESTSV
jgi:hypothetical protein